MEIGYIKSPELSTEELMAIPVKNCAFERGKTGNKFQIIACIV